jgi:uracil-DNA glycosylase
MISFKVLNIIKTINKDWKDELLLIYKKDESIQKSFKNIDNILSNSTKKKTIIYPPMPLIFHAFNYFNIQECKVVILGQDPYHQPGQAIGLSFSVPDSMRIPPSLKNIYKELCSNNPDYQMPKTGNLTHWVEQGVLLLNTSLTVFEGEPNVHSKYWTEFTNKIIKLVSDKNEHIVFMLWGNNAKNKDKFINITKHLILKSVHPSPLSASRGWFGSNHFNQCNDYLIANKKPPIKW